MRDFIQVKLLESFQKAFKEGVGNETLNIQ